VQRKLEKLELKKLCKLLAQTGEQDEIKQYQKVMTMSIAPPVTAKIHRLTSIKLEQLQAEAEERARKQQRSDAEKFLAKALQAETGSKKERLEAILKKGHYTLTQSNSWSCEIKAQKGVYITMPMVAKEHWDILKAEEYKAKLELARAKSNDRLIDQKLRVAQLRESVDEVASFYAHNGYPE